MGEKSEKKESERGSMARRRKGKGCACGRQYILYFFINLSKKYYILKQPTKKYILVRLKFSRFSSWFLLFIIFYRRTIACFKRRKERLCMSIGIQMKQNDTQFKIVRFIYWIQIFIHCDIKIRTNHWYTPLKRDYNTCNVQYNKTQLNNI